MLGLPRRTRQPEKPREAKDIVKESDAAIMLTKKAGAVTIHIMKNVKYRDEVKGLLKEALDSYITNPLLNTTINSYQGLSNLLREMKKTLEEIKNGKKTENQKKTEKKDSEK